MRRLFSLFPLLLPLPNLVLAADPVCTLENRVCAENNNSGKCIRYENTFTCVTLNPAGSRCTVDANPTLTDCTLSAPVCSAESGGICLETTTDFVCKSEPSGEGIRIDDTSVTVSYSKETKGEIFTDQHFTAPPPRFTEASLVKKLEELGIGRPSTYATIIAVLQERKYVKVEKLRFIPEERGRIVTAFLENFFHKYVEYDFTAQMEEFLDDISAGEMEWRKLLTGFWAKFIKNIDAVTPLQMSEVIDKIDEVLAKHLFPEREDGSDPRSCPECKTGRLGIKFGKFGAFIGCSNYPECKYTQQLVDTTAEEEAASRRQRGHQSSQPGRQGSGRDERTEDISQKRPLRTLCPARRRRPQRQSQAQTLLAAQRDYTGRNYA